MQTTTENIINQPTATNFESEQTQYSLLIWNKENLSAKILLLNRLIQTITTYAQADKVWSIGITEYMDFIDRENRSTSRDVVWEKDQQLKILCESFAAKISNIPSTHQSEIEGWIKLKTSLSKYISSGINMKIRTKISVLLTEMLPAIISDGYYDLEDYCKKGFSSEIAIFLKTMSTKECSSFADYTILKKLYSKTGTLNHSVHISENVRKDIIEARNQFPVQVKKFIETVLEIATIAEYKQILDIANASATNTFLPTSVQIDIHKKAAAYLDAAIADGKPFDEVVAMQKELGIVTFSFFKAEIPHLDIQELIKRNYVEIKDSAYHAELKFRNLARLEELLLMNIMETNDLTLLLKIQTIIPTPLCYLHSYITKRAHELLK